MPPADASRQKGGRRIENGPVADKPPGAKTKRGRPFDPAILEKLTVAGLALLDRAGPSGLTIEAVCAEARVSRATFYRRWTSINPVLASMASQILDTTPALEGQTDLRAILVESVASRARLLAQPRVAALFRFAFARAQDDAEMRAIIRAIDEKRDAALVTLLQDGQAAGSVRPDARLDYMTHQLFGPIWHRVLFLELPTDDGFLDAVVEAVWSAIAA